MIRKQTPRGSVYRMWFIAVIAVLSFGISGCGSGGGGSNNTTPMPFSIDCRGGAGGVGAGGNGANAMLYCGTLSGGGQVRNSGAVSTRGGDAAGGDGGNAGGVFLMAAGGDLLHNAAIDTSGGNTSDPTFNGGDGGQIIFQARPDSGTTPAGSLEISGDLIARGGSAAADGSGSGGNGGSVTMIVDASGSYSTTTGLPAPAAQRLSLVGYAALDVSGETGNSGGSGGMIRIQNTGDRWDSGGGVFVDDPCGDVINEAALDSPWRKCRNRCDCAAGGRRNRSECCSLGGYRSHRGQRLG